MKSFKRSLSLLILLYLSLIAVSSAISQQKKDITVDWIFSDESGAVSALPSHAWLPDGTAILYDVRQPPAKRTFERLNPQTGTRTPMLDAQKALTTLRGLLTKSDVPQSLPWPVAFSNTGQFALYIFEGDIFLLDINKPEFVRATQTASEEKSANFSPDGKRLAFVRDNDLYVYDIAGRTEKRITRDGSETILNGTLSWVYWEEIFGRRDIGYWWSEDSTALAFLRSDESQVGISYYVDFEPQYPRLIKQRYPKAGSPNPQVRVGIAEINQDKT
ncbi:MAG: DPP IV N-terminal domain-containing protein, partial [Acidobacteria bacterium]|nr:DPP IV N-terminal domain-containing protein [Acidobacteriota bacterium]